MKHFLKDTDFTPSELGELFAMCESFKRLRSGSTPPTLHGQTWAMLFMKKSTRTRVSFEVGIHELGGHAMILSPADMQLSREESVADTARILGGYVHGLIVRTYAQSQIEEFALTSGVPVVNALTDSYHPCQVYADCYSIAETRKPDGNNLLDALKGLRVAFYGDTACNMAQSWVLASALFGMELVLCGPSEFLPGEEPLEALREAGLEPSYRFTEDPAEGSIGADVVYTDVWVSMGDEAEEERRRALFEPYRVGPEVMRRARTGAIFMHCLPAHEGDEVSAEVLRGRQSIVFSQAANRLHMQKAILSALAEANRD